MLFICIYVYMYICMYVCMYVYIYICKGVHSWEVRITSAAAGGGQHVGVVDGQCIACYETWLAQVPKET